MSLQEVSTFRAFRSTNFTLYFVGRSVSQLGTWMQRTAVVWVVYAMTHSAFMLGLTIFAEQFPSFLLSAFGGVAADRYNRYRIVNITQITSMIQASLLALAFVTGHETIWMILVLSVLLGIINAYDTPARQAMINEVVTNKEDLPSALSLSAGMASLAKLLGPAFAGFILEQYGASICFLFNAASFGCVMLSIAFMKVSKARTPKSEKHVFRELAEGFLYLKRAPSIGLLVVMLSIVSLLVLPYDTLVPVFAKVIFKGNARTFGYISGFIGAGAIVGTVLLASFKKDVPLRKILLLSSLVMSIGIVLFSQTINFPLAMFFAALTGFGGVLQFTICNIIIQSEAAAEMRGRAVSILLMAVFGMLPLGSVVVGAISQKIGAPATLLCQGITGIAVTLLFWKVLKKQDQQTHIEPLQSLPAEAEVLEGM